MCAPRWSRGCLWERLEAGTTEACVWWGPQECGHSPACMRFGQKERAARTSRGPEPRATGLEPQHPRVGPVRLWLQSWGLGAVLQGWHLMRGSGGCLAESVVGQALQDSTQCLGAGVSGCGEHCGPGC